MRKAFLVEQINSLLDLDARGALSPHGIGGLARELFGQCIKTLSSVPELEEVGFAEKAGDHLDIHIDDDLTWAEGEKLYRIRRV